jgi:hypothetical protein
MKGWEWETKMTMIFLQDTKMKVWKIHKKKKTLVNFFE